MSARQFLGMLLAFGAVGLALAGRPASAAPAATPVGNGTPGSCNESALAAAVAGGGLVTFNCGGPQTITLTSALLTPPALTIDGGNSITLTGNLATQLVFVDTGHQLTLRNLVLDKGYAGDSSGGAIASYGALTLDHVRIQNSQADHFGGAILAVGPLAINDSHLENNSAPSGGAIYAETAAARVILTATVLLFNSALDPLHGVGGGIGLTETASLTVSDGSLAFNVAKKLGGALYLGPGTQAAFAPAGGQGLYLGFNQANDSGGAIYNDGGQLVLQSAYLEYNHTLTTTAVHGEGGAIDNRGALSLSGSRLRFNLARFGGGLYASGAGATAAITHTEFLTNTANDVGGGLYAFGNTTTVTLINSSFDGNQSLSRGGGLARTNAHLTIARSSFTHNTAASGGGLYVQGLSSPDSAGYVEVRDSTFSANTATAQHSGGIEDNGLLDLRNVTIKDNQYGLYIEDGLDGAGARLQSTVLDNSAANCDGTGTTPSSGGHNLSSDGHCGLSAPDGDQSNVPAGLGSLARDPGGLTYFHLPLLSSLLINQGGPGCSPTDQRGATRPDACDIGAIEFGGLLPRLWLPLARR